MDPLRKIKNVEKYENILNAAIHVFAEKGFLQATISQVARKAGVADGTIYLYFKNKDDILIQFYELKAKQIFEHFKREVEKPLSAYERLRRLIIAHLKAFQSNPDMAKVYLAQTHQVNRVAEEKIQEMSKLYHDIIADIIETGQNEGAVRMDLYVGLVKRFINGAVDEVINAWLHSGKKYDLISMAEPLTELFYKGIRA